ncbi:MAG TPA: HAMP domain-containing sensor histidine kinase [Desulfobulbus sp.]|nr:HAMP domain-containing sensor histidine kinase [Desulfobulbus sp.]
MKISTRLFLYILTLILLTSLGLGWISVQDERAHLLGSAGLMARTLARTLAATFKYYHMQDQQQRLSEIIHALLPHDANVNRLLINIYDRRGNRIDLTFEHGLQRRTLRRDRLPVPQGRGSSEEIIRDGGSDYLSVLSPIIDSGGKVQGAVEVLLSLDGINRNLAALVRKFLLFVLLTTLLLGLTLYLISRWSITLPLARLGGAARQLGHGDLGMRIEKSGVHEIDELIGEFNRMAGNIEEQSRKQEELFREKIRLERGLRHRDKLASIGQLAGGLAHEIGTPLGVISGRAEQLLRQCGPDDPARPGLEAIIRQADRISRIMRRMLAFARKPESGQSEVDLAALIDDAFSLCRLRRRGSRTEVTLETDLACTSITADADGLRQLFVNLMLNAFQAMTDGGTIRIASREEKGELIVTFSDTGPGIDDAIADRIFDPFFTTREVGEGTGLGLFMAASIVQEQGGRIEVDREHGGGARFIIRLPRRRITVATETGNNHGQ